MTSGPAFSFDVKGLQAGQTALGCTASVSAGDNVLTALPSIGTDLTILGVLPTPTITQSPATSTPTASPSACDQAEFIADITVPPSTVFSPGTQFKKTWRLMNIGTCTWTMAYQIVFFSGDQMSGPALANFNVDVASGETVDISLNMTAPSATGSYNRTLLFCWPWSGK